MIKFPLPIRKAIDIFSQFPGIGAKTAERLVFYLLKQHPDFINQFEKSLAEIKRDINECKICFNYCFGDLCDICEDSRRDKKVICIIEEPKDIIAFEKIGYMGSYHVLGGVISPLDGIDPDDLNINSLMSRLDNVNEIIIATNTSIEGDATALYIRKILLDKTVKISRLARGLPVGGNLDFIDEATLSQSVKERIEIKE